MRYYHGDRRGDTVLLTDGSGAVTDRMSYGIYGEPASRTGSTNTPFLFNGIHGVQTDSNGLTYHRARYYHPGLRRFLNQDSILGDIGIGASLNRFAYANGCPVTLIDPFGMAARDFDSNKFIRNANNAIFGATDGAVRTALDQLGGIASILSPNLAGVTRWEVAQLEGLFDRGFGELSTAFGVDAGSREYGIGRGVGFGTVYVGTAFLGGAEGEVAGAAEKGLGANPFKGKTAQEIADMLTTKGYVPKGPNPVAGEGTFLNPKTGRSVHIDANHRPPKPPHVSVERPRNQRDLPPREYPLN